MNFYTMLSFAVVAFLAVVWFARYLVAKTTAVHNKKQFNKMRSPYRSSQTSLNLAEFHMEAAQTRAYFGVLVRAFLSIVASAILLNLAGSSAEAEVGTTLLWVTGVISLLSVAHLAFAVSDLRELKRSGRLLMFTGVPISGRGTSRY